MLAADTFASILVIMIAAVKNSVTHLSCREHAQNCSGVNKEITLAIFKVGTHDATSRRDQSQGLVAPCELATSPCD